MPSQLDLAGLTGRRRVNRPQGSGSIPNVDESGLTVITQVVGIVAKTDAPERPERAAIEDVAGAALTVGDENLVRLGNIEHALRLVQPCDRMNSFKRGHKETSAPEIDAEMIDAAFHVDQ